MAIVPRETPDSIPARRVLVLYRFFAGDDRLLYVGMTKNPARRFEKHGYDKSWWSDVKRIEMEHHSTIVALREAERATIKNEKPVHNIRMNGHHPSRPQAPREDDLAVRWDPSEVGGLGLRAGVVYALGLSNGECPVGWIRGLDDIGITLVPFNWIIGLFDGSDRWVRYSDVRSWIRAEKEHLIPGERASDGFFYRDGTKDLWLMDPLAAFQTKWTTATGPRHDPH